MSAATRTGRVLDDTAMLTRALLECAMEHAGVTNAHALGRAAGLSPNACRRQQLSGTIKLETVVEIANALRLPVTELLLRAAAKLREMDAREFVAALKGARQ